MSSSAETFWRDPPWRGGKTQFRMGLKEIQQEEWLPEAITAAERRRKQRLLEERPDQVVRRVPGFESQEAAVVAVIAETLLTRSSFEAEAGAWRLDQAALWVPDDLCLLMPDEEEYRLVAACLCSPSYWRLGEKIGKPMTGIHGPVTGLNEAVGRFVHRFMANLPPGRIFQRRNWLIHQSEQLFHPEHESWRPRTAPGDVEDLFLRSETQTLRKFPGEAILFTIRVNLFPLPGIAGYPRAARDLLAGMERMSDEELEAFGYRHHGAALRAYLEGIAGGRGTAGEE